MILPEIIFMIFFNTNQNMRLFSLGVQDFLVVEIMFSMPFYVL